MTDNQQNIVQLTLYEGVMIDSQAMAALRDQHEGDRSDARMGEALESLALALSRLPAAYRGDRFADLATGCREIGEVSGGLGLDRVSRVARTVACLTTGKDDVALAANLARLMRLGNGVLGQIWQLQDQIV